MKVTLTIGQTSGGALEMLYLGTNPEAARAALEAAKTSGKHVEALMLRNPPPFKRAIIDNPVSILSAKPTPRKR